MSTNSVKENDKETLKRMFFTCSKRKFLTHPTLEEHAHPVRELNPSLLRDRQGYSPLY